MSRISKTEKDKSLNGKYQPEQDWYALLRQHSEANFLQSPLWAQTHSLLGDHWGMKVIGKDGLVLMIVRDAKRGRYLEVSCGPLIDWNQPKLVTEAKKAMLDVAKIHDCVFVRFRPQLADISENRQILAKMGAQVAPMHLAAEHTVMIDLTKTEDELMADMRRQTRYEVRKAGRQGIIVEHGNSEELFREFHAVQAKTAARQHFVPPDLDTLLAERKAFGDKAQIYVAYTSEEEGKKPIAYGLILGYGEEADYYEAASTELNRKYSGAYAIQWQAMRDLKQQGYKRYNLWGIAPPDQPEHRYAGVTTFKKGFGGEVINYVPAHDLVLNKAKYMLNVAVETVRKKARHL